MSPFVSPLSVITRAHNPTVIGSVALKKGPRILCPHRSDCCRALMLTCQNSPLWQRCESCNNVCLRFGCHGSLELDQLNSVVIHVTCMLIGMSRTLAAYNYTSSLALWTMLEYELVDANRVCQGIQKVRVEPATRSAVATCNYIEVNTIWWLFI